MDGAVPPGVELQLSCGWHNLCHRGVDHELVGLELAELRARLVDEGEEELGSDVCSGRAGLGCNLVDLLTCCAHEYAAGRHDLHELCHEALAGAATAHIVLDVRIVELEYH